MRAIPIVSSLFILLWPTASHADGCWLEGYEAAQILSYPFKEDFVPRRPNVAVLDLKRGYDDGDSRSCADWGVLVIVADDRPHPDVAGYSFRLRDGRFPGEFPDQAVIPIDLEHGKRGFRFAWREHARENRGARPIDATVEVRLVSHNGKEGEPLLLHIMHPGD